MLLAIPMKGAMATLRNRSQLSASRPRSAFRRRNQRGAALVEAAIVFIPLCVIVFGIIEYGFVFKDSLTLSSATRAGARAASAQPQTASSTFFPFVSSATAKAATAGKFKAGDQMWIYKADANGAASTNCTTDCVKYTYGASGWAAPSSFNWDTANVNACLGGSTTGGNIDSVGVRLELSHDAITGFFSNLKLHERTVMKFEPVNTCS